MIKNSILESFYNKYGVLIERIYNKETINNLI